ncbi:MAG: hypothetical protein V9G04_00385 [Nocardioides sp.]|jgi:hypothetical protein
MNKYVGRVGIAVCATLVMAVGGLSASALAATGGDETRTGAVSVDSAGVVQYGFDEAQLPGASFATQAGQQTRDGGCTFSEQAEGEAGQNGPTVTVTRDVSYDPKTCELKVASATYTSENVPDEYRDELDEASEATGSFVDGGIAPRATTYIGILKVNVEDPVQIDVTSTTARVNWSGTSSCVNSSSHTANWGWYSPSGWSRTYASWDNDRNCSRAYTNTKGKYRNGTFCATIDTRTDHSKTRFEGRPSGGWAWSYTVDKSGGCTSLLHYERIVTTP